MRQTELCAATTRLDTLHTAASDCRESLWAIWGCLLMTLAWLEVAAMLLMLFTGTQRTVAAHKERQRTRRLVDIHINAKLSLCSAAMSPSWSPDRAAWSLRTRSFIFIPAHPLRPKLSRDVSKDVQRCPQNVFRSLLMFREVPETSEGKVWKSTVRILLHSESQRSSQSKQTLWSVTMWRI